MVVHVFVLNSLIKDLHQYLLKGGKGMKKSNSYKSQAFIIKPNRGGSARLKPERGASRVGVVLNKSFTLAISKYR